MFRNPTKYLVELDGFIYGYSQGRIEEIVELKDIKGDKWIVSDFEQAISRIMTVDAPLKYAEVIVRKKLEEAGEVDEPVSIVTHWKKSKTQNTTDVFFTAVPSRVYNRFVQQIRDHEDSVMLFPVYSVLHGALKRLRHPKPVAVVFQHGRFADLIIGTGKRILYANRCVAFDTSNEQISALWNVVNADIATVETENRIKVDQVLLLNWINSGPEPDWLHDKGRECFLMDREDVSFNGEDYSVSFLKVLRMQQGFKAVSPGLEKACYYSRRCLPYLNTIFFLATLLCVGAYFWCSQKNDALAQQLHAREAQIARLKHNAPAQEIDYKQTISFVRDLSRYGKAPSYKSVVNDISEALPNSMSLQVLKVDYPGDEVKIEVFGRAKASFGSAYRGYQGFLDGLKAKGYTVAESKFDTEIRQSEFLTRLTKEIQ